MKSILYLPKRFPHSEIKSESKSSHIVQPAFFVKIVIFLFVFYLNFFGLLNFFCQAEEPGNPVVGFLVSKHKDSAAEKSLVAGFKLFFKEKSLDPSIYFCIKEYFDTEDSLLESLAELIKIPNVSAIVSPTDLRSAEQVVEGTAVSQALIFVTNPAVRLVAGEMCRPNIFRLGPNTYVSSQPLAKWAFLNLGHKVFITGDDSARGNEEGDFFALGIERIGGSFGDRLMASRELSNYDQIFQKLEETKPDFVFAAFSEETSPAFIKAYRDKGLDKKFPLIGVESLTAYPEPIEKLKNQGLGIRTLCSIKDPQALNKLLAGFSLEASNLDMVAQGYDMANVFYSCIQGGCFTEASAVKAAEFVSHLTIDGPRGKIQFDGNHEAIIPMSVCHWEHNSKGLLTRIVDEQLDPCRSLDFGCGAVGFPDRPEPASTEAPPGIWEEHHQ